MAFDERAGAGWCQHLQYDDLVADPVDAVGRLYGTWGEEVSPLHARRMRAFLAQRPQDAFGRHRYDPEDFGWTYAQLAAEFGGYTERYGISTGARAAAN
jgi:hypothetical protein